MTYRVRAAENRRRIWEHQQEEPLQVGDIITDPDGIERHIIMLVRDIATASIEPGGPQ
jgi:hypothetical protein